jgi:putative SOS response-associated peptidase YedK
MCGRFASVLPPEAMRALFRTTGALPNLAPNWNVAPSQEAPVVRRHPESGERRLDALRWGFIPRFNRDPKGGRRPINARAETAASFGLFRDAFAHRRCLVPADAFYEWHQGGAKSAERQPYAIARADGATLALAGIWDGWRTAGGEIVRSFAILTTAANSAMRKLHERMPVILEAPDWPLWLGEVPQDPAALLRPAAETVLRLWPVSRRVNHVANNGPELLLPEPGPEAM